MKAMSTYIYGGLVALCLSGCSDQRQEHATLMASDSPAPPVATSPAESPNDATAESRSDSMTYELPGAFSADTSLDSLRSRLEASDVAITTLEGSEGSGERGVVIFPDDETRRAELYFQDTERLTGLQIVRVSNSSSRWHLPFGVRIGMSVDELQKANATAFEFNGLDWDYGGIVTSWNGGRLDMTNSAQHVNQVRMGHTGDELTGEVPTGDSTFLSDDPKWSHSGLVINEIGVAFK